MHIDFQKSVPIQPNTGDTLPACWQTFWQHLVNIILASVIQACKHNGYTTSRYTRPGLRGHGLGRAPDADPPPGREEAGRREGRVGLPHRADPERPPPVLAKEPNEFFNFENK